MSEYDFGNTRVRCRRAALLDAAGYARLLAQADLQGVLGLLERGPHGPDVEEALARTQGLACLQRAILSHLARELEALRSFYAGRARRLVDLFLGRWELASLVAVLRGVGATDVDPAAVVAVTPPAGALDGPALDELARQPTLRAAVELLVGWGLPTRRAARVLARALPDALAEGNPTRLEEVLVRERARRLAAELDPEDPDDAIVRRVAFAEVDRSNLLGALRLRAARALGEAGEAAVRWAEESHVPGGRLGVALLDRLARAPTRADAHGELRETAPALWQPALERWRSDGDLPALDVGLRRASALRALALHYTTDPAGVGVPVAYAWAKQLEADNLRQIGLARLRGLTPEQVRERLVIG